MLKPDERGRYTREIIIMEEDLKLELVRWCMSAAKSDDLSMASARDYINGPRVLGGVEPHVLESYHIKIPISLNTTWHWLKRLDIRRGVYVQSYYNDKHEDQAVLEYRKEY